MKRALSAALAGLLTFLPIRAPAQDKPLEHRVTTSNALIEREVNKWGPWVNSQIESGYRDGRRTKRLAIYLRNRDTDLMSYEHDAFASYDGHQVAIRLPADVEPHEIYHLSGAVNHEIAHSLFGENGLIRQPGYSGPSEA